MELSVGPAPPDEPPVGMALLNLTGEQRSTTLQLAIPGTVYGLTVRAAGGEPAESLRSSDIGCDCLGTNGAVRTAVACRCWRAEEARPSSRNGNWVAMTEPDVQRRQMYRDLALVFAELSRELVNWQQALEGWQMQESQVILGWINRGKQRGIVETTRANLLELVRLRLQDPVPETIRLAIEGTNDENTLNRWFRAAATANSLADLSAADAPATVRDSGGLAVCVRRRRLSFAVMLLETTPGCASARPRGGAAGEFRVPRRDRRSFPSSRRWPSALRGTPGHRQWTAAVVARSAVTSVGVRTLAA